MACSVEITKDPVAGKFYQLYSGFTYVRLMRMLPLGYFETFADIPRDSIVLLVATNQTAWNVHLVSWREYFGFVQSSTAFFEVKDPNLEAEGT